MERIIFITGTDTGVGKTVVTALLTAQARARGLSVAALKPFCSGERTDAELLCAVAGERSVEAINPWFFPEPISPWTAARRAGTTVRLVEVLEFIRAARRDFVLVEGAGGLMSPLGERFAAVELIRELGCEVILVAANRLGVINQVRMALAALGAAKVRVALTPNRDAEKDVSAETNLSDLREWVAPVPVTSVPFLPDYQPRAERIEQAAGREGWLWDRLVGPG